MSDSCIKAIVKKKICRSDFAYPSAKEVIGFCGSNWRDRNMCSTEMKRPKCLCPIFTEETSWQNWFLAAVVLCVLFTTSQRFFFIPQKQADYTLCLLSTSYYLLPLLLSPYSKWDKSLPLKFHSFLFCFFYQSFYLWIWFLKSGLFAHVSHWSCTYFHAFKECLSLLLQKVPVSSAVSKQEWAAQSCLVIVIDDRWESLSDPADTR